MTKKLKTLYISLVSPCVVLFSILAVLKEFYPELTEFKIPYEVQPIVFVMAAITSIAGPVFLRTYFAGSVKDEKRVETDLFYRFQKRILLICLVTPYFAFVAILFSFEKFYSSFLILLSLYSLYYYFPSEKRVNFDKKIFRVK